MKTTLHSFKSVTPLATPVSSLVAGIACAALIWGAAPQTGAEDRVGRVLPETGESKKIPGTVRSPEKALETGLDYLLKQQHADGGWGQGGGWRQGHGKQGTRVDGGNAEDPADLGNTCVSMVALLRSNEAAGKEATRGAIEKAFGFVCRQVENADTDSLYLTSVRDTQLQVKIGTYVDTFLAGWALSELKGHLPDDAAEKKRSEALDKVVAKIERNQREDGSFKNNSGWAAVLSQGLCSKALNSAARTGAKVSTEALDRDQRQNLAGLDVTKGDFSAPVAAEPSSAGISLYREAAKLGGLRAKLESNVARKTDAQKRVEDKNASADEKEHAQQELKMIAADEQAAAVAQTAIANKLGDARYVAGFGNNGGEEFLSYLNLGESMRERGGNEWASWKEKMQATLCSAQNEDGSWAGQHCITGRNFCTATALLTLLVERANPGLTSR